MKIDQKKILGYVKSSKPTSQNHRLICQDDFLDGVVAQVEYKDQDDQLPVKRWVIMTNKYSNYADSESQLIQQMNVATNKSLDEIDWIDKLFNVGGTIALVLVLTACYLSINDKIIPEFLKASLLTVIGFYFGGFVQQSKKKKIGESE